MSFYGLMMLPRRARRDAERRRVAAERLLGGPAGLGGHVPRRGRVHGQMVDRVAGEPGRLLSRAQHGLDEALRPLFHEVSEEAITSARGTRHAKREFAASTHPRDSGVFISFEFLGTYVTMNFGFSMGTGEETFELEI